MKKIFLAIFAFFVIIFSPFSVVLANGTDGAQGSTTTQTDQTKKDDIKPPPPTVYGSNVNEDDLKRWNVNMDTIPDMIAGLANTIIMLAGTISSFMLIYFAVKMQLASGITGDASGVDSAKKWMIAAGIGFVLSVSAWFIMARIVDIFSITT